VANTTPTTNLWIYVVFTLKIYIIEGKSAPIPLPQEKDYCKVHIAPLFLSIIYFNKRFHKQHRGKAELENLVGEVKPQNLARKVEP
jgi:hypothetical protein